MTALHEGSTEEKRLECFLQSLHVRRNLMMKHGHTADPPSPQFSKTNRGKHSTAPPTATLNSLFGLSATTHLFTSGH